ncbi:MAG: glycosyltransferase family 39 protein [Lentisphaeria bacterium]|nr:glycosyltransferase family 39 protein [Lentisphaeria bacterium]
MKRERVFGISVFLFTVGWFSLFAVARVDLHHDAVMLKPAIDVAAGRVLFRDSFCQYGALAVWLQALAVKLFGGELVVIRLLTVLFYGGIAVLSDRIFRRFLTLPFRLVNLVMFWGMTPFYLVPMHPWSSVYALFFMLLSTEFILRFIARDREREVFFAGVFSGAAFLARHPCGVVSFGAGAVTLVLAAVYLKRRWRGVGAFAAGMAAVAAGFAVYLTLAGAWRDYLRQCFGFVGGFAFERGGGGKWSEISARLFPLFEGLGGADMIYAVLPLGCAAVAVAAFRRLSRRTEVPERVRMVEYLAVALAGLASWHQYYPVPCVRHLYWAAIPMFGVAALGCGYLWRRGKLPRMLAVLLLLPAALPIGCRIGLGAIPFLRSFGARRSVDLPGCRHLRLSGAERALLEGLRQAYAELPPGIRARGVFNYTEDAMLSVVFPETAFRHPMFVNWRGDVYPEYPEQALAYILRHRPPVVAGRLLELPGYRLVYRGGLYGKEYWFYSPLD